MYIRMSVHGGRMQVFMSVFFVACHRQPQFAGSPDRTCKVVARDVRDGARLADRPPTSSRPVTLSCSRVVPRLVVLRVAACCATMGGCASQPSAAVAPREGEEGAGPAAANERRVSVLIDANLSLDFEKVMDDTAGMQALLTFAKSEFNDEVLAGMKTTD